MLIKTVIATGVGAAVLLGGGAALAATASASASPHSSASSPSATSTYTHRHHQKHAFRGEYGQWTSYDAKTKASITHDGVRGTVSAVSPGSVSVKAKDGTVKTYLINASTKVHGGTKTQPATISQVKTGDHAVVIGTGTSTLTATHIYDNGK